VATLTLQKTVVNDNGGTAVEADFTPSIDGNVTTWGTAVALDAGDHKASETTLAGYTASDWGGDCAADGSITLSPGQNATCTITNDDVAQISGIFSNHTTGGEYGNGSWQVIDPDTLAPMILAETQGLPRPFGAEFGLSRQPIGNSSIAFAFNPVDGYFYGVLPDSGIFLGGFPLFTDKLVRFNPNDDSVEYLGDIPLLLDSGATEPYRQYAAAPVISPDGKSMMLVARFGGISIPRPTGGGSDEIGGLIHVNIDPASGQYLEFTVVYAFADFAAPGADWKEHLKDIISKPLLASTSSGDQIFLLSDPEEISGSPEFKKGRGFSLSPSQPDDWSQPWKLSGQASTFGARTEVTSREPYYNPSTEEYHWVTGRDNDPDPVPGFTYTRDANTGATVTGDDTIPYNQSVYSLSVWGQPGTGRLFHLTQGTGGTDIVRDTAKIVESVSQTYITRRSFTEFLPVDESVRLLPAGTAHSPSTGYFYMNVRSFQGLGSIVSCIEDIFCGGEKFQSVSSDPYFDKELGDFYAEYNILPARIDRLDYGNYIYSYPIYRGAVDKGYIIAGAPALGADAGGTERYLVSYALSGGEQGSGAILKHDLFTGVTTSIPFGNSTPGQPFGKAIHLASGKVLGSTRITVGSGLKPQVVDQGAWAMDLGSGTIEDFTLPVTDVFINGDWHYAEQDGNVLNSINFATTADGGVWGVTYYKSWQFDFTLTGLSFWPALVAFDASSGKPTGELHLLGDSPGVEDSISGINARGNLLTFTSTAEEDDGLVNPFAGARIWFVDVANRDANNTPENTYILLDKNGASSTAWDAPFAPVPQTGTEAFYVMTLQDDAGDNVQIHRIDGVADSLPATPSMTPVVSNLSDVPATPLFEASDGNMYYCSTTGKLVRFDPQSVAVTEAADLTESGKTSSCLGYLSEPKQGTVMGVVADSISGQSGSGIRGFRMDLSSNQADTFDASGFVSPEDNFPGFISLE
jgi:hypothetical protein